MNKTIECVICGDYFNSADKKIGKINECDDCTTETVDKYTGNMIYDHKTGCQIQINSDPELTKYIIESTKLRSKTSNLGNNLKVNSGKARSNGLVYAAGDRARRRD